MKQTSIIIFLLLFSVTCLFSQNDTVAVFLNSKGHISNSIIYGNDYSKQVADEIELDYSATDRAYPGIKNIQLHTSPFVANYQINASSPVYNKGSSAALGHEDSLDLAGLARVMCKEVDMGAYEYPIQLTQITKFPTPLHLCQGLQAVFSAEVRGTNVSYQWQRNGRNIDAATSPTLSFDVQLADTGVYRLLVYGACGNDSTPDVRLKVDALPSVVARPDTTVLKGADVLLYALSSVGELSWYEHDGSAILSNLHLRNIQHSATYFVVAKHGVCKNTAHAEVHIKVLGDSCFVETKADTLICRGDSCALSLKQVQGTFAWYILGTNTALPAMSNVHPNETTHYEVVVTNSDAICRDTFTVEVHQIAFAVRSDTAICGLSSVRLYSSPPARQWLDVSGMVLGQGNDIYIMPEANTTSLYIGVFNDELCEKRDTVKVTSNPLIFEILPDTTICRGDAVYLTTNIDSNLVRWSIFDSESELGGAPTVRPLETTTYIARVYNQICGDFFKTVTITVVPKPDFVVAPDTVLCQGSPFVLWASPNASYWTSAQEGRLSSLDILAKQTDTLIAHYLDGICHLSDTLFLQVDPFLLLVAMDDTTLSLGTTLSLHSQPIADQWFLLDNPLPLPSVLVTPDKTSSYIASLDAKSCGLVYDTVVVTVISDSLHFYIDYFYTSCEQTQVSAMVVVTKGTPPYRYLWSNGTTDSLLVNVSAGTYSVEVRDANNFIVTDQFSITDVVPMSLDVNANPATNENCDDGFLKTSVSGGLPPYTYLWNNGLDSPELVPASSGAYTLSVTDSRMCKQNFVVDLACLHKRVFPTLFLSPNDDGMNDYLHIQYIDRYPRNKVSILNPYGEEVARMENYNNQSVKWSGRNKKGQLLPDGTYYYVIQVQGMDSMVGVLLMRMSKKK